MKNIKLSVVIITRNEENEIEECLQSVYGWADEIIVVDDESQDKTIQIAKNYTNKVFQRKMDVEGSHRNWAYSQASNEWVLSLDADERVTEELKKEIFSIIGANPSENGFSIPRKNFIGSYWVKYSGWYPSAQLKLFRKDKFRYEESEVHPRAFLEGGSRQLKSPLLHYSYDNFEDFLAKLNRQTTLEAKKWFNQGKKMTLGRFLWRAFDRFMRSYIRKKGFKDGFIGFLVAFNAALYQIVSYLKFREIIFNQNNSIINKNS